MTILINEIYLNLNYKLLRLYLANKDLKNPEDCLLLIQLLTKSFHSLSPFGTIIAKNAGFFSPSGTIVNWGYLITNLLASV